MNNVEWFEVKLSSSLRTNFDMKMDHLSVLIREGLLIYFKVQHISFESSSSLIEYLLKSNLPSNKLQFLNWLLNNKVRFNKLFHLSFENEASLHELNYFIYLLKEELDSYICDEEDDLRSVLISTICDLPYILETMNELHFTEK